MYSCVASEISNGFIHSHSYRDWFSIGLPIYHCEFNTECYSDTFFNSLHIEFPNILKTAVVKRRAEFLAGRYCAMRCLQRLNFINTPIGIGNSRQPIWPDSVVGSISHCSHHAVAVTGKAEYFSGIGVDIEWQVNDRTFNNLANKILCKDEQNHLGDSHENQRFIFTLIFSVKESFFKAAYPLVGRYFDFDAISVVDIDWYKNKILLHINYSLNDLLRKGLLVTACFQSFSDGRVITLITL